MPSKFSVILITKTGKRTKQTTVIYNPPQSSFLAQALLRQELHHHMSDK